ncbi:NfeD family protein [Egicoccus halophilus]|uniref:Serine protease n=1 Tax=Egicoccus halophilus TaxID=1670830 RepID=A0A8J3ACU9_9ACTN|nr:nodulation protein NfeD [Egicoccus halophilus]GGI09080.1 serine protease [Egicoccus halophilus]
MNRVERTDASRLRAAAALACLVAGLLSVLGATSVRAQAPTSIATTTVTGAITPVTAEHLADTVALAAQDGHQALVVLLDTPGGLVDATRRIAQSFLDAPLPVVVYVAPAGADAGSAGTFITYAGHVAAMAPATTIGAATPVDLEGGEVGDKIVENAAAFARTLAEERGRDVDFAVASVRDGRSVTAATALEEGVVDLIADDLDDLLGRLDGADVEVRGRGTVTLTTAGATTVDYEMSTARTLLAILADPNLAFVFLSLGTLGILYEIASPGLGLGGVIGVASLVLAMFSLAVLPVNWAGAVLLVVAFVMFVAELFMPGVGVGAAGGTGALVLGGLFLFQDQPGLGVDWWVIAPTAVLMLALTILAGRIVWRSRARPSAAGSDDLLGRTVVVRDAATGTPRARVSGSYWRLQPLDGAPPLRDGQTVEVVDRHNLDLVVVPVARARADGSAAPIRTD